MAADADADRSAAAAVAAAATAAAAAGHNSTPDVTRTDSSDIGIGIDISCHTPDGEGGEGAEAFGSHVERELAHVMRHHRCVGDCVFDADTAEAVAADLRILVPRLIRDGRWRIGQVKGFSVAESRDLVHAHVRVDAGPAAAAGGGDSISDSKSRAQAAERVAAAVQRVADALSPVSVALAVPLTAVLSAALFETAVHDSGQRDTQHKHCLLHVLWGMGLGAFDRAGGRMSDGDPLLFCAAHRHMPFAQLLLDLPQTPHFALNADAVPSDPDRQMCAAQRRLTQSIALCNRFEATLCVRLLRRTSARALNPVMTTAAAGRTTALHRAVRFACHSAYGAAVLRAVMAHATPYDSGSADDGLELHVRLPCDDALPPKGQRTADDVPSLSAAEAMRVLVDAPWARVPDRAAAALLCTELERLCAAQLQYRAGLRTALDAALLPPPPPAQPRVSASASAAAAAAESVTAAVATETATDSGSGEGGWLPVRQLIGVVFGYLLITADADAAVSVATKAKAAKKALNPSISISPNAVSS